MKRSKNWISSSFGGIQESFVSQGSGKRKKQTQLSSGAISAADDTKKRGKQKKEEGLWIDKHKPKAESELAVHKKKIAEVSSWLLSHLCDKPSSAVLLLTGPVGCGKTATLHALSAEYNFQVQEWINPVVSTEEEFNSSKVSLSYQSQLSQFKEFLLRANKYPTLSIFGGGNACVPRKVILVEDLPNVFYQDPAKFHEVLKWYQESGRSPVVLIISDSHHSDSNLHRVLPRRVQDTLAITAISYNPVAHTSLVKVLTRIATNESQKAGRDFLLPSKDAIDELANSSAGDIRSAVNSLQFMCLRDCASMPSRNTSKNKRPMSSMAGAASQSSQRSKQSSGASTNDNTHAIGARDSTMFLFRALGKILYCKRNADVSDRHLLPPHLAHYARNTPQFCPEEVAERTHLSSEILNLYLHQNVIDFFTDLESASNTLEYISDADMMTAVWMHRTSLIPYTSSITTRGIMFSNSGRGPTTSSTRGGWRPLHKPDWFEINKRTKASAQMSRDLFPDLVCPSTVLHTELLPYLAITDSPLKSPGQISFLQQVARFQKCRLRGSLATLDEKDFGGEPETLETSETDKRSLTTSETSEQEAVISSDEQVVIEDYDDEN